MILLSRAYAGYAAGTVVQLSTQEEAAAIAQGFASNSSGPVTPGNVSTTKLQGRSAIAAGQTSVVITNPAITAESRVSAVIAQAAADGTATSIVRIVPAAGSVTIFANAAATAATTVDWAVLAVSGLLAPN